MCLIQYTIHIFVYIYFTEYCINCMSGKIKRKIFNLSKSRVVTLPLEWKGSKSNFVYMIFNKFLLIVPAEESEKVEVATEKMIKDIIASNTRSINKTSGVSSATVAGDSTTPKGNEGEKDDQ